MQMTVAEIETRFGIAEIQESRLQPTLPRFNVAPSQGVLAIIEQNGKRILTSMRWGFAPAWMTAKRPPPINARAETIAERPTFRAAYRSKRCLLPADGFYEWVSRPGQARKQPMRLRLPSDRLFAFAGIYTPAVDGELTCAIVTTTANEHIQQVHQRMPVILDPDLEDLWLDPTVQDPSACLASTVAEQLEIFPVSALVSSASNEGHQLVMPLT